MTITASCPSCGAPLPVDAPIDALCPACFQKLEPETTTRTGPWRATETLTGELEPIAPIDPTRTAIPHWTPGDEPTAARLRPGQVFGPYRIDKLLGKGGMGEVYAAEHIEQQRRVALKVLSPGIDSPVERERFLREGQLAASISHPHTVYVFGTADIDGLPTIAMELVAGGTLKDQVAARGPLPVDVAVDTILQVIAGLEAARAAGILHRDIKPSNCFVERNGVVKVGDFGLSISALAGDRAQSGRGERLGTPAFAAPEQLNGDWLDVRADIYAVGVTLFFLLTGAVPFEDTDLARLVEKVVREPAPSARVLRPAVPGSLARIIGRCLAKDRAGRPADYASLVEQLAPFSSTTAAPAPLPLRYLAFMIDTVSVGLLMSFVPLAVASARFALFGELSASGARAFGGVIVAAIMTPLVGWVWLEGRYGAGPGKKLCGLRVVRSDVRMPSLARAALRFSLFFGLVALPAIAAEEWINEAVGALIGVAMIALVFLPASRRNGYAGVHELWSGTRTIVAAKPSQASVVSTVLAVDSRLQHGRHRIGPYIAAMDPASVGGSAAIVALDPLLRRRVWIHVQNPTVPVVQPTRRDLNRSTRLRWLTGSRGGAVAWDAYEAPEGAGLPARVKDPESRRWTVVRVWLRDLADEIRAADDDGTLPPLRLKRVWVDQQGRARLIDFEPPGTPGDREKAIANDLATAQQFLREVAGAAVDTPDGDTGRDPSSAPPPRRAVVLADALARGAYDTTSALESAVRIACDGPSTLARGRRSAQLAFVGYLVLLEFLIGATYSVQIAHGVRSEEVRGAKAVLALLAQPDPSIERPGSTLQVPIDREVLEMFAARRFAHFVTEDGKRRASAEFTRDELAQLQDIVGARDDSMALEDERAALSYGFWLLGSHRATAGPYQLAEEGFWRPSRSPRAMTLSLLAVAAVVLSGIAALAATTRGGLGLYVIGAAVVDSRGREVSRRRAAARALLAWIPAMAFQVAMLVLVSDLLYSSRGARAVFAGWEPWVAICAAAAFILGFASALVRPERGWLDRLLGTWLVPK